MPASLAAAIEAEIGGPTEPRVNPVTSSVGTSVARIASANPNRFALTIVNLGAVAIYVAPDNAPSSTRGIRLAPSGGALTLNWRDDFQLAGWDWFAIADAAATAIFVMEVNAR